MNDQDMLSKISNTFEAQGLIPPWIPPELAGQIIELPSGVGSGDDSGDGSGIFCSRAGEAYLYDLNGFVAQYLADPAPAPAVALGFAGHGLASQGLHYYLSGPRLGVFLQLRWGTLFDQPDDDAPFWKLMLKQARELYLAAAGPAPAGFPPGQRLVVVDSHFSGARYAWVDPQAASPIDWTFLSSRGAISVASIDVRRRARAVAPSSVAG